ncbi:MAG: hypothetical protein R3D34_16885 [Nitratireductor sp.]
MQTIIKSTFAAMLSLAVLSGSLGMTTLDAHAGKGKFGHSGSVSGMDLGSGR